MRPSCGIALLFVFLSSLVAAPAARADAVVEPATGISFETERLAGGRPYALVGVGARKRLFFTVYGMALYVELEGARRAFPALARKAGSRTKEKLCTGDRSQSFVVWGDFGKLGVLRFLRDVPAEELRADSAESMEALLGEKAPPELRERVQAFIALFDRNMKKGEELSIETTPMGNVELLLGGVKKEGPTDPRLARAVWDMWLGSKPISTDLRKALVERIEVLGK